MQRSLLALALSLAFAAPAAAQDTAPASSSTVILTQPVAPTTAYVPPSYAAPAPTYTGRGRSQRVVIGTRHELQNDRGLWGLGLGLALGGWALDIALTAIANAISTDRSAADEQDAQAWSILPVVGPLVQLGIQAPHPAIPITAGLMQIGGLVLFVMGLTSTHDAEVPVYAFGDPHDARTARLGFGIEGTSGGAMATLTLHAM